MHLFLIAAGIFCMRICDVSIGTVRVIYTIRGRRLLSAGLGVLESGIWIVAISRLFVYVKEPASMVGWSLGFGAGTFVGITLEKWIATGHILMRIISTSQSQPLRDRLLGCGVGVTEVAGTGRDGNVQILFVVAPRRRGDELLRIVEETDPDAFITLDPTNHAAGGYLPMAFTPSSMRK